ncbi:BON domain-containing protein [Tropicimonas sp. IMCC6043]|uniref:BON domain-containing protein n=1 Tax=Tropicimonas sp. IMCC6043 TaxID=2510645 RepID=UPI00101D54E9|nr:BON domain-containing protein [Tropicimonas sp. IMCC6043]RYH05900.1 BON domain-containing protein [Tropicimonas sp. IMCC6043]
MTGRVTYKFGAVLVGFLISCSSHGWAETGAGQETTDSAAAKPDVGIRQDVATELVQVTLNSAVAIESEQPFTELSIANPSIADISTISETLVYVLGKSPGNTTLMLLGQGGELMRVVDIRVVPDITEFTSRLEQLFPDQEIEAITANDGIVLMGTVDNASVMQQALELASHYAPGQISNLMTLKPVETSGPDLADFERRLRDLLPEQEIAVEIAEGKIVLTGEVDSPAALENATKLAESFVPGQVTSFLTLREAPMPLPDVGRLASALADILPDEDIKVHLIGDAIVLSGHVSTEQMLLQASEVAKMLYGDATISNMLTVSASSPCVVRTRKAGEMTEINVPCQK